MTSVKSIFILSKTRLAFMSSQNMFSDYGRSVMNLWCNFLKYIHYCRLKHFYTEKGVFQIIHWCMYIDTFLKEFWCLIKLNGVNLLGFLVITCPFMNRIFYGIDKSCKKSVHGDDTDRFLYRSSFFPCNFPSVADGLWCGVRVFYVRSRAAQLTQQLALYYVHLKQYRKYITCMLCKIEVISKFF